MAITIPGLPAASDSELTDLIEVSQSGASKKETLQQVLALYQQQIAFQPNNGFEAFDLSASNIALTNPAPTLIQLNNATSGRSFILPAANESNAWPVGTSSVIIYNTSANAVALNDADGNPVASVDPNAFVILGLTDNSTEAGVYVPLQFGGTENLPILNIYPGSTEPAIYGQTSTKSNGASVPYYAFTPSGLSYLFVECMMPKNWNGGNIVPILTWFTANPQTLPFNEVTWFCDAAVLNDGDSVNPIFGTAQSVTDGAFVGGSQMKYSTFPAITPSGTPATNSILQLRFSRNGGSGSDNMPDAALLRNIQINYTDILGNIS